MKKVAIAVAAVLMLSVLTACGEKDIPDVTGTDSSDASQILKDKGFSQINYQTEDNEKLYLVSSEKGYTVISQDPAAGSNANSNGKITLTVRNEAQAKAQAEFEDTQAEASIAKGKEENAEKTNLKQNLDPMMGGPAKTAYDYLTASGYTVTVLLGSQNYDYTSDFINDSEGWIASSYSGLNVIKKAVTLKITTPGTDAVNKETSSLDSKLSVESAWTALEQYGDKQYPQGFKAQKIVGNPTEAAEDEDTWLLTVGCTITNSSGVEEKNHFCKAEISGTTDSPKVVSFEVE
ncbi:MAG: PASTA domain-containing protein [Eggerthellaceae bacterium]|nr:PASTA domain-containing protein [Eggerthellaceae bacterium]MCH4220550.1 PASTA domain-containing protein [Eggerthellaceae bacterium]